MLRRNYLRVRGEYGVDFPGDPIIWELPPRARRILDRAYRDSSDMGTTSACAENTDPRWVAHSSGRNYLRVRGEYPWIVRVAGASAELPPRARRIP